jgi:predicted MFS family arabinose efflux permease
VTRGDGRPHPALVLAALWLLVFAVTSQTMILAPILPRIAEQLRVSEARLSVVATGYAVAVAAVAVVAGPVSDRYGRRRMLLAGAGAMTVALASHLLARGLGSLLTARVLTGAAGGILTGATGAYIADYFPPERRGWANGWVMSGMAAGQVLGIPLGSLLASRWGFRFPFLAFAGAMALAFLMVWAFLPQPEVALRRDRITPRYLAAHYRHLLKNRAASVSIVVQMGIFLATSLYVLYLPTWLEAARGADADAVALLFAVGGVATVVAGPAAGRLSDRVGRRRLVLASSFAMAIVMLATPWIVRGMAMAFPVFFAAMAMMAARAAPFQALQAELVPDEQRGALMSLSMATGQAGAGIGGAIAGAAYAFSGYPATAALAAAASLAIALLVWRALPETRRT